MSVQANPQPARLARNASIVVVIVAALIAGYLSYLKVSDTAAVCIQGAAFDCGTVLNSAYSELGGIPIAWLGLALDLVVLALLLLENRTAFLQENGRMVVFGVVLFGFLYSVYLVYLQAAVLRAFCPWCLSHEALITILFGLTIWRLIKD